MQHPPHLLLMEPAAITAAPIRALLEQNGFRVDVAEHADAVDIDKLSAYAAIIIDVAREGREAIALIRRLHAVQSHLVGRIVVMTADEPADIAAALEAADVCGIVPKPIHAEVILRTVYECLESSPAYSLQ